MDFFPGKNNYELGGNEKNNLNSKMAIILDITEQEE